MATASESISPPLVSEVNLTHYVDLLKRRWFWIIGCGVLGAVIAFAWGNSTTSQYTAQTDLAILRTGTIVNFDPRFRTVSDADPNATGLDALARRRSLITIGESPALLEQVIQKLGDQIPTSLRTIEGMQAALSIVNDGDTIRASASTVSPATSALIANAWAEAYVAQVNRVFSESGLESDNLNQMAAELKQDYEVKQQAVTEDKATSPIQQRLREMDFIERQLNVSLEEKLVRAIEDATALRTVVASGTGNATDSQQLAMLVLQLNLLKTNDESLSQIGVPFTTSVTPATHAQLTQELDALIANLKERRAAQSGPVRDELYSRLRATRAQVEIAEAKTKYLEWARDLAWNTFQLMASKVTENTVAAQTQSKLVRIASPAVAPTRPQTNQVQLKTVLGGLAGAVIGAALALFLKPR